MNRLITFQKTVKEQPKCKGYEPRMLLDCWRPGNNNPIRVIPKIAIEREGIFTPINDNEIERLPEEVSNGAIAWTIYYPIESAPKTSFGFITK